jgi:hypothetical protein
VSHLIDSEMMRDDARLKKGENTNTDRWHGGPAWETLGASVQLCCAWIYIVKISIYLQSRLQVHKTEKRGDSKYPCMEWSRTGGPVASTYRAGRRACWVVVRQVDSGCSRPNVHWYLTSPGEFKF